ncbi:NADP-dependent oxidoreductase domain [Phytophthora cactorum]|nr:NADP-dependent oxidoreductase domain [Phytophthora cactorum]
MQIIDPILRTHFGISRHQLTSPNNPNGSLNRWLHFMTYRFLGNSGLLVSKLGLGSWMEYGDTKSPELWYEIMKTAFERGVNLFDNADSYGVGLGEEYMGAAIKMGIKDGTWKREDLVRGR